MSKTYNNSITNKLINKICDGRLTLESGVPVSTTDQIDKDTIYFTPYNGNTIGLYDGNEWDLFSFSELSLSLSGFDTYQNHDIFIYNNNGTLTLEGSVWSTSSSRSVNLAMQDGIYVKSSDFTRRYLGTIRTSAPSGSAVTTDSLNYRLVWNMYNRVIRPVMNVDNNARQWTYGSSTWRVFNNPIIFEPYIVSVVNGVVEEMLNVVVGALTQAPNATTFAIAISENSFVSPLTSTVAGIARSNQSGGQTQLTSLYYHTVPLGYAFYLPLESAKGSATTTVYITGPNVSGQGDAYWGGIRGTWKC